MPEGSSGVDMMRERMERARRRPPPPRHPRSGSGGAGEAPPDARAVSASESEPESPQGGGEALGAPGRAPTAALENRDAPAAPEVLGADVPPVNLAIRVRRPLDDRLADIIYALRSEGVRTSKVELIEMLLWELPVSDVDRLIARLGRFREWAPRGAGAPLAPRGVAPR